MKIKWFGHACFLLTFQGGIRILTDPFDESVGYAVPKLEADIVTISHAHYDHNNTKMVKGSCRTIDKPGCYTVGDIDIIGTATYHDKEEGKKRGDNIVFTCKGDGVSVCHLGDLGHIPSMDQIKGFGNPDILLLPIGGTYTIDYREAIQVIELIKPKLVIPMHFKTPALSFSIDSLDKFLNETDGVSYAGMQEIEVDQSSLNSFGKVVVLDYE